MMKLSELLHPWVTISSPDCEITGLGNDSRHLVQGDLFFAYPGALTDGRLFMEQACLSGAAAIVYDPQSPPPSFVIPNAIPCIPVVGLGAHLSAMASRFYAEPCQHLAVTGVTGTNGKTTIAWLLAQAYERLSISATYIGTLGYGDVHALQPLANTTPDALFLQRFFYDAYHRGVEQVCMEVSSHALSQGRVACIDFTGAIYTNLSHEHLDYHLKSKYYP